MFMFGLTKEEKEKLTKERKKAKLLKQIQDITNQIAELRDNQLTLTKELESIQ